MTFASNDSVKTNPAAGADRGHCVHGEPVPSPADDGSPALGASGAAGDLVRADRDLVAEENPTS